MGDALKNKINENLEKFLVQTKSKFNIYDQKLKEDVFEDLGEKFKFDESLYNNSIVIANKRFEFDIDSINQYNINSIFEILKKNKIWDDKDISFYEKQLNDKKNDHKKIIIDIKNNLNDLKKFEIMKTYFNLFDALRKRWIEEFIKKMKQIEEMTKNLKSFKDIFGRFWDLSEHDLYKLDNNFILKLEKLLQDKEFVVRIAELLGRLASSQKHIEEYIIKENIFVPSCKRTYSSPENTTSIKFGNDLAVLLKYQLALRNKDQSKKIFNLNYIEKKLLQLDQNAKLLDEKETTRIERRFKQDSKGPFIMCVDTSGSMYGEPETIAKALCLAIFRIARKENRKCFIINFSTGIVEFDASDVNNNFAKFYEFLSMSFSGGTDVEPALKRACQKCKENDYKNGDVIIISDFIINQINDDLHNDIKKLKENKIRFNALSIGHSQIKHHMKYFDNNWVYDGSDESINKILNDLNKISQ